VPWRSKHPLYFTAPFWGYSGLYSHNIPDFQSFCLSIPRDITCRNLYLVHQNWYHGVRGNLIFAVNYSMYNIWILILTTDSFRLPCLDTLILNVVCYACLIWTHWFWLLTLEIGPMAGVTDRQMTLTPPRYLIPPLEYLGVHASQFLLWIIPSTWSWH
jgi:hypothetical protein